MKKPVLNLTYSARLFAAALVIAIAPTLAAKNVQLPAGSVNGLAAAVAAAGPGGRVIVKTGNHTENGTVVVGIPVTIIGETTTGAVILSNNAPSGAYPLAIMPVIEVRNTKNVLIKNIDFRPTGAAANTAILINNSPGVEIRQNSVNNFQFGVFVQRGNSAVINGNAITLLGRWRLLQNDPMFLPEADGIVIVNGQDVDINNNVVDNGYIDIFVSDTGGASGGNTVTNANYGYLLGRVPQNPAFYQVNGTTVFSDAAANFWLIHGNSAMNNAWGFLLFDGANNNTLKNNSVAGNTRYDIEMAGASNRFGYPAVATFNNLVKPGNQRNLVVKDCGTNNKIKDRSQVIIVNNTNDPCF